MTKMTKGLLVAVMGLGLTAAPAAARGGFHGGVGFHGGFGRGVIVRPFGFYGGFYDPWFWGPYGYAAPYWGYGYSMPANAGKVKIETHQKDAQVYIDGAYAGTAKDVKDMWLRAGAHNIEVRAPGNQRYSERVYVVSGKTLKLEPGF